MWKAQPPGGSDERYDQGPSFPSQFSEPNASGSGSGRTDGNGLSPRRSFGHPGYDPRGGQSSFNDDASGSRAGFGRMADPGQGQHGYEDDRWVQGHPGAGYPDDEGIHRKRPSAHDDSPESSRRRPRQSFSGASDARSPSIDGPQGEEKGKDAADREHRASFTGTRRATQACLRCRRQKLRCLGGWPCDRCERAKQVCDFGKTADPYLAPGRATAALPDGINVAGSEANARLEQLESNVARLLAGLAGGGVFRDPGVAPTFHGQHGEGQNSTAAPPTRHGRQTSLNVAEPWSSGGASLPQPTHVRRVETPRTAEFAASSGVQPSVSPDELNQHVRFGSTPNVTIISGGVMTSPSNYSSGISPNSMVGGGLAPERKRTGKGQKAEERLAAVTEGSFEPPFKALVYQPAVWDNREQSRRSSPQPSGTASRDEPSAVSNYERRFGRERDDPLNTGLVDPHMAEALFNFFIEHCHPFLPIVNVALDDAFTAIQRSPPLFSAIIAIAARFYVRFTARNTSTLLPMLDPGAPHKLANLAEMHLAQTLLRKQHALSDVQAILLLAAWGLQSGGKGPDAWLATGHAARVARRLGVHRTLAVAAETARNTKVGTEEWQKLEQFSPQWRTWLCWFCFDGFLSLGFGRPQSTQFETVDEQGFLQLRLSTALPRPGSRASLSLNGDVYVAGQVQLTQIGRDLINWGEILSDPERALLADPRRQEMVRGRDLSVGSMLKELNDRLDEWCKLWVWAGSPYTLYLGSSARFARLQAEHMRLCLNSYALKSSSEADETASPYLKKALNAAMSTIQTHFESSQTDLALAFATDYLTITLSQAAVFLIRLTKAPQSVRQTVSLDSSVVGHYLKMSVDLLEQGDLSETRLSTYLAKTIRDISRAAGITVPGLEPAEPPSNADIAHGSYAPFGFAQLGNGGTNGLDGSSGFNGDQAGTDAHIAGAVNGSGQGVGVEPALGSAALNQDPSATFDLDGFFQVDNSLDLSYLLGLPGDNAGQGVAPAWSFGGADLEFGLGDFGLPANSGSGQGSQ